MKKTILKSISLLGLLIGLGGLAIPTSEAFLNNILPQHIAWHSCSDNAQPQSPGMITVQGTRAETLHFTDKNFKHGGILDFFCHQNEPRFQLTACETFSTTCPFTPPTLEITNPKPNDTYTAGEKIEIQWTQQNVETLKIGYNQCEDCSEWIIEDLPIDTTNPSGTYTWSPPLTFPAGPYQLELFGTHPTHGTTQTKSPPFQITAPPTLEVRGINQNENEIKIQAGTENNTVIQFTIEGAEDRNLFYINALTFQFASESIDLTGFFADLFVGETLIDRKSFPPNGLINFTTLLPISPQVPENRNIELRLAIPETSSPNRFFMNLNNLSAGIINRPENIENIENLTFDQEFLITKDTYPLSRQNHLSGGPFKILSSSSNIQLTTRTGTIIAPQILYANQTDAEILNIRLDALGDTIQITDLYLKNEQHDPNRAFEDRAHFKLYNANQFLQETLMHDGELAFLNLDQIIVPQDEFLQLTIKTDIRNITNANQTGAQLKLTLDTEGTINQHKGLQAIATSSSTNIPPPEDGWGEATSETFIAYKSEFFIQHAPLQSSTLNFENTFNEVYAFRIDSHYQYTKDIGRISIALQLADLQLKSHEPIRREDIRIKRSTQEDIANIRLENNSHRNAIIHFDFANEPLASGDYKTFHVFLKDLESTGPQPSITTQLLTDETFAPPSTRPQKATENQNIIWSDESAQNHSTNSPDWLNGYLLEVDTTPQTNHFSTEETEPLLPPIITIEASSANQRTENNYEVTINDPFSIHLINQNEVSSTHFYLEYYNNNEVFPEEEGNGPFGPFISETVDTWTFQAQICRFDNCSEWSDPFYVNTLHPLELTLWPGTGSSGNHELFDILIVSDLPETQFNQIIENTFGNEDFSLFSAIPLDQHKEKFNIYYHRMEPLTYRNRNMCRWGTYQYREESEFFAPIFNQHPWADLKISIASNSYVWPHAYPPDFNNNGELEIPSEINIGINCNVGNEENVIILADNMNIAAKIMVHEIGHAFGDLQDEYLYGDWALNEWIDRRGDKNCASANFPVERWNHIEGWDNQRFQGCFVNEYCEYENTNCTPAYRGTNNSLMRHTNAYNAAQWRDAFGPINKYYLNQQIENVNRGIFDR